jgi:hypothetical protein
MNGDADLSAIGALLADRTGATILVTLLGGALASASALAARAGACSLGAALTGELLRRGWLGAGEATRVIGMTLERVDELRVRFGVEVRARRAPALRRREVAA